MNQRIRSIETMMGKANATASKNHEIICKIKSISSSELEAKSAIEEAEKQYAESAESAPLCDFLEHQYRVLLQNKSKV